MIHFLKEKEGHGFFDWLFPGLIVPVFIRTPGVGREAKGLTKRGLPPLTASTRIKM